MNYSARNCVVPSSMPASVPSLVGEDGYFAPSAAYRVAMHDLAALEDVERECEAQYQAFVALVGREPDYVDIHAVSSVNFFVGVANVAARHGKPSLVLPASLADPMHVGATDIWLRISQANGDDPLEDLDAIVATAEEQDAHMLVFHPGYVDAQLVRTSSVTLARTVDTETLGSAALREFIALHDLQLVTYRDL